MKLYLNALLASAITATGYAQGGTDLVDIPTTAVEAGMFSTLVAALDAAGLVGALSGDGSDPLTVFAPTDDAFSALPDGLVDCLLKDIPVLTDILLYHVTNGSVLSTQLMDEMEVSTLLGGDEKVTVSLGNGVKINDSNVILADVLAINGVIHVIDQVLVPGSVNVPFFLAKCKETAEEVSALDIPGTAIAADSFNTLVAALDAADLVGALAEPNGPFTVFAPTDDAFSALPDGLVDCLLEPENKQSLIDVLFYHVASGQALSTDLNDDQQIATLLEGAELKVDLSGGTVKINDSTVITPDVIASNGVIHIIDQVLVPPRLEICGVGGDDESEDDRAECSYLGVARSAGQYLTGPTHTCLCTTGGHWIDCRPNTNDKKTIEQVVTDSDQLSTLEAAIRKAGILGVLDGPGPFSLFAPTDRAFQKIPTKLLDFLLTDGNESVLAQVLQYHVYSGEATSSSLPYGAVAVPTLLGGVDEIDVEKTCWSAVETCQDTFSITLNDSSYVVAADVSAANGLIHIIEEVLIPPSLADAVNDIIAD